MALEVAGHQGSHQAPNAQSDCVHSLLETSLDPLVIIGRDGTVTDVNEATVLATGVPRAQLIGTDFCRYFADPEQARKGHERALSEGAVRDVPLAIRHASGFLTHVLYNATIFRDEKGEIAGVFAAARNVTERKRADDLLRQQWALLDLAHDAVLTRDLDGTIRYWNGGARSLYGWEAEEAIGKVSHDLLKTGFPIPLDEIVQIMLSQGNWEGELRHITKSGEAIIAESRWALQKDEEGRPIAVMEINRETTNRKEAERQIAAERQKFNMILDSVPPYVVLLTPDYHVAFANREFRTRFGESNGRRCYEFLFGRTEPCEICETYKVLKTGEPGRWDWTGPDGREYDIYDFPFTDTDGSAMILEMGIDVTQRETTERAMLTERKRFESVLHNLPVMVSLLSPEREVVFANKAFRERFGDPRGRKCHEYLFGESEPCRFCEAFQVLETQEPHSWECPFPNGRLVHVFSMPFVDVDGSPRVLKMDIDITEQRAAEETLRRVNRTLRAMNHSTEALMKATDEAAMLQQVCDTVVNMGGYRMAWVGFAEDDADKTVRPIAQAGFEEGYLGRAHISWADVERGRGPTGRAIRTGNVTVCQDITRDPQLSPWRDDALARGYNASISLPLRRGDKTFGAITIYAAEPNAFDEREKNLLEELGNNLSYAINTLRERAERQRAEQEWKATFDTVSDSVMLLDEDFRIRRANRATGELLGIDPNAIVGRHCYEVMHGKDRPIDSCQMRRMLATGKEQRWDLEDPWLGKVFDVVVTPFQPDPAAPAGCIHVIHDITAHKQAQEKLRKASLYARTLLEASLDPLVTISREGVITDVNEATERITGCSREQLIGSDFCDYFSDPEDARRGYREVFTRGQVRDYPLAVRHTSGSLTQVLYNASVFRNEAGEIEGVFAAARDVTELKRVEAELRKLNEELEQRVQDRTAELQAIFDTVPIGLSITNDLEGRHIRGNPELARMLGARSGSELSKYDPECPPYQVFQEGRELETHELPMQRAARGEFITGCLLDIQPSGGELLSVHASTAPLFDKDGNPRGAVGAFADITPQKHAEEALRESERSVRRKLESILSPEGDTTQLRIRDLLDTQAIQLLMEDSYQLTHIPMWLLNLKGEILAGVGWQDICMKFHRVNPATCANCRESDLELTKGVEPGQFRLYKCKNNIWDVVTPVMLRDRHLGNLYSGQFFFADEPLDLALFQAQARRYGFDEKEYLAALQRAPRLTRDQVNNALRLFVRFAEMLSQLSYSGIKLARSMTDANRANALLEATNKELESFNYAVAHDLRAPLRHIQGFANILTEETEAGLDETSRRHLKLIGESVQHMERLLEDLLALSRLGRRDLIVQVCDLNELLAEVIEELRAEQNGRNVEWRVGKLPVVECDRGLMKQVMVNLLRNALKFSRPRDPAVIEVGETTADGETTFFVRDNGVGFDMKYVDKLFGIFQRLHRQQDFEGNGVGLAIVERIIHRHGGSVWAEGVPDEGATFYFRLQPALAGRNAQ